MAIYSGFTHEEKRWCSIVMWVYQRVSIHILSSFGRLWGSGLGDICHRYPEWRSLPKNHLGGSGFFRIWLMGGSRGRPPKMDAAYFMENPKTSKLDENSNYPNGTTGIILENWPGVYPAPICEKHQSASLNNPSSLKFYEKKSTSHKNIHPFKWWRKKYDIWGWVKTLVPL